MQAECAELVEPLISAIGTGVSALSQAQQSNYQAKVADQNAKAEGSAAHDAIERGKLDAQNQQRELSAKMGAQRAALAANGIDVDFGNAALVRGDIAQIGQEDVYNTRQNATREAGGYTYFPGYICEIYSGSVSDL